MSTKTLKVRVKDRHAPVLNQMARSVNFTWNYINNLSFRSIRERGIFLSAYDIQKYTNGAARDLGLNSHTVLQIGKEYAIRRKQFKKAKLAWRKSGGSRRSLGWIPINTGRAYWKNGQVYYNGHYFKVWDSYGLGQYKFRSSSFNEDARGRWYFNVVVDVEVPPTTAQSAVGIDLGLKDIANYSDGSKLENERWYRSHEDALAKAQRAKRTRRARAIHAKISNKRKDALHKESTKLVREHAAIFVGDVSCTKLAKTRMAKSVNDAGWGMFKTMLQYKGDHAGCIVQEINEAYTTRTCSSCGSLSGPKGVNGLSVRQWTCVECGSSHDRDHNAALNILAAGLAYLAEVGHGLP